MKRLSLTGRIREQFFVEPVEKNNKDGYENILLKVDESD